MTKTVIVTLAVLAAVWGLPVAGAEAKAPKNQTAIAKRVPAQSQNQQYSAWNAGDDEYLASVRKR